MQLRHDVTQAEIDAAIIACLRIFAARGRALRLQREKSANASGLPESAPGLSDSQERESSEEAKEEQRAEEAVTPNAES